MGRQNNLVILTAATKLLDRDSSDPEEEPAFIQAMFQKVVIFNTLKKHYI